MPRFDAHERRFRYYDRVVAAVEGLYADPSPLLGVEVSITAGLGEENLDNNREVSAALAGRGWNVRLVEHRDAHNWVAWRDALHPHLAHLLL